MRWLAGLPRGRALDIGCGGGRHAVVLRDMEFTASGCDASGIPPGVSGVTLRRCDMTALPYLDQSFDVALAYGVFYYGTRDEHRQAIAEMRRVMRPGGGGFVCIRTENDWRQRFTYNGVFHCHNEPEDGMPMHFLTEYEVQTMYGAFSEVRVELTETTRRGRTRCDSDWLIEVTK